MFNYWNATCQQANQINKSQTIWQTITLNTEGTGEGKVNLQ